MKRGLDIRRSPSPGVAATRQQGRIDRFTLRGRSKVDRQSKR
jgi:hypothetical protein